MSATEDENKAAGLAIFGSSNVEFKKYESLLPKNDYDREKAEVLAEAMTELVTINKRKKFLESLLAENKKLKPYLWESIDGRVQAIHAIEPSHFENIIRYLVARGSKIPKEIRAEAAVRGVDIPENYSSDEDRVLSRSSPMIDLINRAYSLTSEDPDDIDE